MLRGEDHLFWARVLPPSKKKTRILAKLIYAVLVCSVFYSALCWVARSLFIPFFAYYVEQIFFTIYACFLFWRVLCWMRECEYADTELREQGDNGNFRENWVELLRKVKDQHVPADTLLRIPRWQGFITTRDLANFAGIRVGPFSIDQTDEDGNRIITAPADMFVLMNYVFENARVRMGTHPFFPAQVNAR